MGLAGGASARENSNLGDPLRGAVPEVVVEPSDLSDLRAESEPAAPPEAREVEASFVDVPSLEMLAPQEGAGVREDSAGPSVVAAGASRRWDSALRGATPARAIEAGWLLAVVVVPLVYWSAGRDSYELPKQIALRSILFVSLAAATSLALFRWATAPPGPPLGVRMRVGLGWLLRWPAFWVALAVNGAWTVATLGSVAPEMSFWGTTNRWAGLRTEWTYGALFVMGAAVLTRREQLTRLAGALAVGGVPVAVYALWQRFGPQHPWVVASGLSSTQARPFGTLGNPIFLADLALISGFVVLGPLVAARGRRERVLWGALLVCQLSNLLLPQSRAAWLAALVGLGALAMAMAAFHGVRRRIWLTGPLLAAAVLAAGLWAGQAPLRAAGMGRVADLLNPAEYAAQSRLLQWKAAGLAWLRRPLLGFGPETFESIIERDWSPELQQLLPHEDLVYDRAHNAVLDALVAAGALGGTALLAAGVVLAVHVRRLYAHYRDEREAALALGFGSGAALDVVREAVVPLCAAAGLMAYLTGQQFGIQTVASSSIAWLLAGGLFGLAATLRADAPGRARWVGLPPAGLANRAGRRVLRLAAALGGSAAAALLVALLISFELRPLRARLHDDLGVALHRAERLEEAVAQLEVATAMWPHNFRHWAELAYSLRAAARPKADPASHAQYHRAVLAAERTLAINPVYPRVKAYFGDVGGEAAVRTGDATLVERAIAAHAEATTEAPLSWRYREMAAQTFFQMRRVDAAKLHLQRAVELWSTNWTLWAALGDAGVLTNDRETARRAYLEAQRLNPSHEGIQRALAALG